MEIKVDLSKSGLTMEEIRQKKLEIDGCGLEKRLLPGG